jgi:serine/threonine-protein kinase HipA
VRGRLATLDNALTQCDTFELSPQAACEVVSEVWQVVHNWRQYFEASGVEGDDIEKVASAFRSIDDIASEELRSTLP